MVDSNGDDRYARGSVWTIPFKYEDVLHGTARAAGGTGYQKRVGQAKDRCWIIVLKASADHVYVRLVLCRTMMPAERPAIEQDNLKVIFEADERGGWTNNTVADGANVRTVTNVPFLTRGEYQGRITEKKMREVDAAAFRGLGLTDYRTFPSEQGE